DDAVEVGDAHVGHQHLEPARFESFDVEALFHGEAGTEQANLADAVGEQRVGSGGGDVDHLYLEVTRDARVADVHGVGREADDLAALRLERQGGRSEDLSGAVPVPGPLK